MDREGYEFFDLSLVAVEIKSRFLSEISSNEVLTAWEEIVGEPLCLYSKVFLYEKSSGKLSVCSNDGMCLSEISGRKNKILKEYRSRFPRYLFRTLETRFFYNM